MSTQEQAVCEDERIRAGTPLRRARGSSVAIVYRFLPRWRVDFFNQLRGLLGERGIELQLLYGRDTNKVPARHRRHKWGDEVDLDWAKPVRNRILSYRGYELIWQDLPSNVYENELIILMQENCIVSNHWATLRAKMRGTKIALWGHGLNLQAPSGSLGNRIKQLYSTRVDWWFAYTNSVAEQVSRMGFARDRITVVQNAIDTNFLRAEIDRTETSTLAHIRRELKLGGGPVGIFCGAMYHLKRLSFLTEACLELRRRLPRFGMIFLGEGPDSTIVKAFCDNHTWAHYLGPKHGAARVPYFKLADIFLMPGLVGLAVLDSFALETPMITTDYPYHSPEIEYLQDGVNGIRTENSIAAFADGARAMLEDGLLRRRLIEGGRSSARQYTVKNMAQRFADGVEFALMH